MIWLSLWSPLEYSAGPDPSELEQGRQGLARFKQMIGPVLIVVGNQVVDAHGVIHGFRDVRRCHGLIRGIFRMPVTGTESLTAPDSTACQDIG